MKTTEKYEAPLVETIEVAVEKGFAGSPLDTGGGMGTSSGIGGDGDITGGSYN